MSAGLATLLIANRGEIACRIARTARRMGIRVVAVYSDADRDALHVALADEAYAIGPPPASESYLDVAAVLDAARRSGADAIHPGYGFLSENADFAEACAAAGIIFVGPPPTAIRAMGGKSAAKALMAKAGVPLVPGYHGDGQSPAILAEAASAIGYPVLIKASAGGGGRGMRVVESADGFVAALEAAQRESAAAFGDDRVLIEKYLARPRHVEVQVLADGAGTCLSLWERDCSIQRRHQKVVEEAPAPGLDPETRIAMGEAAVAAARAIGYVSAGTVEFLLDTTDRHSFFFMEMNTRLQVEHPVTELITGLDLVEWQLRIAAGEPLSMTQEAVPCLGHAIEVRIYAEDPANGFLPAAGTLRHLAFPAPGPHVRIDGAVRAGDAVSIHYDPMIAKLIVWDDDRPAAVRRLRTALAETQIAGLTSNLDFLRAVAGHSAFAASNLDTGFIDRHAGDLLGPQPPIDPPTLALAALGVLLTRRRAAAVRAAASPDPWSPWHTMDEWRLNDRARTVLVFRNGETEHPATVTYRADGGFDVTIGGADLTVRGALAADGTLDADIGGVRRRVTVLCAGADVTLLGAGTGTRHLILADPLDAADRMTAGAGRLTAPMPGRVVKVLVAVDQQVAAGTPLIVVEAMKMEHTVTAPAAGRVTAVPFGVGDQVDEGADLIDLEPDDEAAA